TCIHDGIAAFLEIADHLPCLMLADTDARGHRGMQTVQAPVVPGHGLAYPLGDLGILPGIRPRQKRQELLPAPAPDTVTFAQGFAHPRAHLTQHPVAAAVPVPTADLAAAARL